MKQLVEKSFGAVLAVALLCAVYPCGNASAASLVVLDLAEIVDQTAPSVVEVFTETKQVSSWFQEYVTEGAGSGVVLTEDGELVGVVCAKSSGSGIEGLAFAIHSDTVGEIAGELMENGYVAGRPQLGVSAARLTRPGQSMYFDQPGVYIVQVARENGLKAGDRILQIDGTAIQSTADISAVLDRHSAGDKVRVELVRSGQQIAVNVTLTEKGPE